MDRSIDDDDENDIATTTPKKLTVQNEPKLSENGPKQFDMARKQFARSRVSPQLGQHLPRMSLLTRRRAEVKFVQKHNRSFKIQKTLSPEGLMIILAESP